MPVAGRCIRAVKPLGSLRTPHQQPGAVKAAWDRALPSGKKKTGRMFLSPDPLFPCKVSSAKSSS